MDQLDALALAREKVALKEKQLELREGLPFLYGWKWYPWAKEFFDSLNKICLLCAANQISKSSTQIRKCINWATDQKLWETLWPTHRPIQFWYLNPTMNQADGEFLTKWSLFLPRGKYKDDPVYGWEAERKNGHIYAIHFNSGVHIFFKTYAQDVMALQTGTCDAIFCDEELPVEVYDELIFRISASEGYFNMVFTATMGQEFWRLAMQANDREVENLPTAHKQVVSMYDCLKYEDGSDSHWSEEKIQTIKNRCKSSQEILKRVYGFFILDDGGKKYEAFNIQKNVLKNHPLPTDWLIYTGVDVGGGGKSHPGAIVFCAVRPDFRMGRIFLGWRGEGIGDTTAGDIFDKFVAMKKEAKASPVLQAYDWASKDFKTIADRAGEGFTPADKDHERGEQILNVLFKNEMLAIYDTPELQKLISELTTLRKDTPKNKAKDDFCDALRYSVTRVPWDWAAVTGDRPAGAEPEEKLNRTQLEIKARREEMVDDRADQNARDDIASEINEWNDLHNPY